MNAHIQPWKIRAEDFPTDSSASDQLEFLLGYAILAPSPYNTQPWLFRLMSKEVDIYADGARSLRIADPDSRELVISCGAALFNLKIATEYFGHQYHVELEPNPNNSDLLARFRLDLNAKTSSEDVLLFQAIKKRRTNHHPFLDKPIPTELIDQWAEAANKEGLWFCAVQDEENRRKVASLVAEADRILWHNKLYREEIARWSRAKLYEHADGFPSSVLGIKPWLSFAGKTLMRNFDRGAGMATMDQDLVLHSPILVVLGSEKDDLRSWMHVGEAMQHILLSACFEDVHASFLNQPTEVPEIQTQLAELLGLPSFPQVILRLGYSDITVDPTPRRSVKSTLIPVNAHSVRVG